MGKKGNKKRLREEEENENNNEIDPELEEEIAVLNAIKEEENKKKLKKLNEEEENEENDEENNEENQTENKRFNYNKEGLLYCIESLGNKNQPFIESMNINDYEIHIQDENDDLERELAFYNHALQALQEGRRRFAELKIPFNRPDDYFCESLKSDAHMARIKDRLIIEEKRVDAFEKRKQRELNRKFNKQVSELKKAEKAQHVKKEIKDVGQYKDKKHGEGDRDNERNQKPQKSFRRQAMDKKYGFGGKDRKKAKLTDQKSLNDFSQYSVRGGKNVRREKPSGGSSGGAFSKGRKGGKNGKGANRPGKSARMERRAARSKS